MAEYQPFLFDCRISTVVEKMIHSKRDLKFSLKVIILNG